MDTVTLFSQPKPVSDQEQEKMAWAFGQLLLSPADAQKVWQALFAVFFPYNNQTVRDHYATYWKWFVVLTWEHPELIPPDRFVEVFLAELPTACLLRDDVEALVFYYLYRVHTEPNDLRNAFNQIRTNLPKSTVPINPLLDASPTLGAMTENMERSNVGDDTVLEASEVYTSVKQSGYESEEQLGLLGLADHAFDSASNLLRLIVFFSADRDIVEILYDYFDTVYEDIETYADKEIGLTAQPARGIAEPSESSEPEEPTQPPPPEEKSQKTAAPKNTAPTPPSAPPKKTETQKPSYGDIRKQIESTFSFSPDGQPKDVEGVLARLDALSAEYGDENITALLYFNESTGRFEWNADLFTS